MQASLEPANAALLAIIRDILGNYHHIRTFALWDMLSESVQQNMQDGSEFF